MDAVDQPKSTNNETVMVFPVDAIEALEVPTPNQAVKPQGLSPANAYSVGEHHGRDNPFPCFKKSRWDNHLMI